MWVVAVIGKGRSAYRTYSHMEAMTYAENVKLLHPELNVFLCREGDDIESVVNNAIGKGYA